MLIICLIGTKIHLGYKKMNFLEQLRKDAEFLASLNIMDYSLLVGIHDRKSRAIGSASSDPAPTSPSLQAAVSAINRFMPYPLAP